MTMESSVLCMWHVHGILYLTCCTFVGFVLCLVFDVLLLPLNFDLALWRSKTQNQ